MPRHLSDAQRAALAGPHRRGGPHRPGTKPARHGEAHETRVLVCPVCGRPGANLANWPGARAAIRRTAGYKQITWRDSPLTREEREALVAALRHALAELGDSAIRPASHDLTS